MSTFVQVLNPNAFGGGEAFDRQTSFIASAYNVADAFGFIPFGLVDTAPTVPTIPPASSFPLGAGSTGSSVLGVVGYMVRRR